jgi:hypothetical protein
MSVALEKNRLTQARSRRAPPTRERLRPAPSGERKRAHRRHFDVSCERQGGGESWAVSVGRKAVGGAQRAKRTPTTPCTALRGGALGRTKLRRTLPSVAGLSVAPASALRDERGAGADTRSLQSLSQPLPFAILATSPSSAASPTERPLSPLRILAWMRIRSAMSWAQPPTVRGCFPPLNISIKLLMAVDTTA